MNYLLETYVTDDVIAEINNDIMPYAQPVNKTPIEYAGILWSKALQCDCVYDDYVLKGIFIVGPIGSIRHSMHACWGSR